MLEKDKELRVQRIQRELHELDKQQKNLLQELYSIIGIRADYGTSNTKKNRLSKDEFRRLCSA